VTSLSFIILCAKYGVRIVKRARPDQGNPAILDGINALAARFTGLENRLTVVENRLTVVENRQHNTGVCAMNARRLVCDSFAELEPVVDVRTGQPTPNFPRSWPECQDLSDAELDIILDALRIDIGLGVVRKDKMELLRQKWVY